MSTSLPNRRALFGALAAVLLCAAFSHAPRAEGAGGEARAGRSRFAAFENMRVHYTDAGKGGEALVFVHGWMCNLDFWRMQTPALAAKSRVIAVDLPGHGRSDKPQQVAYSMDLFARAVEAVMRDAGVRRAVLVGHSMGTPVVRQFYRRYPEKTLALVIVDGGLRPFVPRERMEPFVATLRGEGYREGVARMVEGIVQPVKSEALRAEIRAAMLSAPKHVAVGALDGMMEEAVWKEDQIRVPVLAVLARAPFWPPDNEQFFRRIAPDLDYRMWDGVSHFLMMEKPDEFNRAVSDFLSARRLLGKK